MSQVSTGISCIAASNFGSQNTRLAPRSPLAAVPPPPPAAAVVVVDVLANSDDGDVRCSVLRKSPLLDGM